MTEQEKNEKIRLVREKFEKRAIELEKEDEKILEERRKKGINVLDGGGGPYKKLFEWYKSELKKIEDEFEKS